MKEYDLNDARRAICNLAPTVGADDDRLRILCQVIERCALRDLRTPGTIEVPVSEVEALRKEREKYPPTEECGRQFELFEAIDAIIARLPKPAPDHVAVLEAFMNDHRRWLKKPGSLCPEQLRARIAAFEAAIASLSKEKP